MRLIFNMVQPLHIKDNCRITWCLFGYTLKESIMIDHKKGRG